MRIAQVPPLYESVPPKLYGGTERVVSYLTEELLRLGHEVTVFGTGDSRTSANLVPVIPSALRLESEKPDELLAHTLQLEMILEKASQFDFIHFHTHCHQFPALSLLNKPHLTTLHGRLDLPLTQKFYRNYSESPLVSISLSQRKPLPDCNWVGNVYHGIPSYHWEPPKEKRSYLAFLGRLSKEKRPDLAIEIAEKAGLPLKVAAKIDPHDNKYFHTEFEPRLLRSGFEYLGEVNEHQKADFLRNAKALLFPIDWPEPFGLVMIEALSQGTPVIAFRRGSVPEILQDGRTGFICNSADEAVEAVKKLDQLDSNVVREIFEKNYTAGRMAQDYQDIFEQLVDQHREAGAERWSPSIHPISIRTS